MNIAERVNNLIDSEDMETVRLKLITSGDLGAQEALMRVLYELDQIVDDYVEENNDADKRG